MTRPPEVRPSYAAAPAFWQSDKDIHLADDSRRVADFNFVMNHIKMPSKQSYEKYRLGAKARVYVPLSESPTLTV
jgi:hypothetical protein